MVKTRVTDAGIINEPGSGFESTITKTSSQTLTANKSLTALDAGVIILSASAGALTVTMPPVADPLGSLFAFRSTSPSAHILTASVDAGNTFCAGVSGLLNVTGSNGSSITLQALAGSSVTLISDGAHWNVLCSSGTITFAKGAP